MNNVGEIIKELRKRSNLTQSDLAQIVHVSDKTISKWELGISIPDSDILVKLSEYFNVPVEDLIKGNKDVLISKEINKNKIIIIVLLILTVLLSILLIHQNYKTKNNVYIISSEEDMSLDGYIFNTSDKQIITIGNFNTKMDFGNDLTKEITILIKSNNTIINSLDFDNETPLESVNSFLSKFKINMRGTSWHYLNKEQLKDLSLVIEYLDSNNDFQYKKIDLNVIKL